MNKSIVASTSTEILVNRYQLKQLIGRGGMGEVFLANDVLLGGVPVAIKIGMKTVSDRLLKDDFAREARICAALSQNSIHIVRVTDYGVIEESKPFYVMEYLYGKSLKNFMPMPVPKFLVLFRQICLGLQCAHKGINIDGKVYPLIHRDIKPANILVIPDPVLGQLVKILDFGIAKFLNYSVETSEREGFYGTLPYCSPEQLEGDELDSRSDIYSLGVMMFEMLTGNKPWQPETNLFGAWYKAHHFETPRAIAHVNPSITVPPTLNDLIMACLAKSPSDRPQNIGEVLKVLESLTAVSSQQSAVVVETEDATSFQSSGVSSHNSPSSPPSPSSIKEACKKLVWSKDKPIQEIVFPHLLNTEQGTVAALSLMMSQQQIKGYALSIRYSQFIFTSGSPMLLWVTVLYNRKLGIKWLKSYLDMQNRENHLLVCSLAESESYPLIFFSLEAPHTITNVLSCSINPSGRQMLKTWVEQSTRLPPSREFELSKHLLKQQYQQMQSQILQRLASTQSVVASL